MYRHSARHLLRTLTELCTHTGLTVLAHTLLQICVVAVEVAVVVAEGPTVVVCVVTAVRVGVDLSEQSEWKSWYQ